MANIVTSYIKIRGNQKAQDEFRSIMDRINGLISINGRHNNMNIVGALWGNLEYSDQDISKMLGAPKWCFVESADFDELIVDSANYSPDNIVFRIASLVSNVDSEAIVCATFMDEGPNFWGALVAFRSGDQIDNWKIVEDVGDDQIVCSEFDREKVAEEHGEDAYITSFDELWEETKDMIESLVSDVINDRSKT